MGRDQNIMVQANAPNIANSFSQVKIGNTSEDSLYQIRHIFYCFYQSKEFTKKNTLI